MIEINFHEGAFITLVYDVSSVTNPCKGVLVTFVSDGLRTRMRAFQIRNFNKTKVQNIYFRALEQIVYYNPLVVIPIYTQSSIYIYISILLYLLDDSKSVTFTTSRSFHQLLYP